MQCLSFEWGFSLRAATAVARRSTKSSRLCRSVGSRSASRPLGSASRRTLTPSVGRCFLFSPSFATAGSPSSLAAMATNACVDRASVRPSVVACRVNIPRLACRCFLSLSSFFSPSSSMLLLRAPLPASSFLVAHACLLACLRAACVRVWCNFRPATRDRACVNRRRRTAVCAAIRRSAFHARSRAATGQNAPTCCFVIAER